MSGLPAAGFSLPVRIDLLAHDGQQAAVVLPGFLPALQLLKAQVDQIREILYGIGTFWRDGHGRSNRQL